MPERNEKKSSAIFINLFLIKIQSKLSDFRLPLKTINRLWKRFDELDKNKKGVLDSDDFHEIHSFHLNPLAPRIIDLFMDEHGHCDFEGFCKIVAVFQPCDKTTPSDAVNSPRSKTRLLFRLFGKFYLKL
jgi:Ca2+-binding EF-hand superfamily protein